MKKFLIILLLNASLNALGQNLVPNPGFEKYLSCPTSSNQLSCYLNWSSFSKTPDYYNEYGQPGAYCIIPPNMFNGFQYPHSGNAFAGFITFSNGIFAREIIGAALLSSLSVGQRYYISFYVSLAGKISYGTTIASNKTGIKFSTVSYSEANPAPIDNFAHFYCNDIITDTLNWVKISGSFIADSAYTYVMIGNFFDDAHTDTINLAADNAYGYYYIDDVCVSTDSLYCANWTGVNENNADKKEKVEVYPNPAWNKLYIDFKTGGKTFANIKLFNMLGMQVGKTTEGMLENNKTVIDVSALAPGMYLLKIETGSKTYDYKIMVK